MTMPGILLLLQPKLQYFKPSLVGALHQCCQIRLKIGNKPPFTAKHCLKNVVYFVSGVSPNLITQLCSGGHVQQLGRRDWAAS